MHYQKTGVSVLRTTAILWAQTVVLSHIEVATASTGFSLGRKEAGACAWLLLGFSSTSAAGAAASWRTSSPDSSQGTSLASPSEEPVFEWGFDGSSSSEPDSAESEIVCTSVSPVKPLPLPVKDLPLPLPLRGLDGALALWTRLPTTMPAMWKPSLTVIHG